MDDLLRKDLSALLVTLVVGILCLHEPMLLLHPIAVPILVLTGLGIWVAIRPYHAGLRSYLYAVSVAVTIGLISLGILNL